MHCTCVCFTVKLHVTVKCHGNSQYRNKSFQDPIAVQDIFPKMSGHGHSHSGGHGHSHSHEDLEGAERGNLFSLYLKIDTEKVECLNEESEGSGKDVFKPWDQRLDTEKVILTLSLRISPTTFIVMI